MGSLQDPLRGASISFLLPSYSKPGLLRFNAAQCRPPSAGKRSISLAWMSQRAAPTPLTAVGLVVLRMLDTIGTRCPCMQLQSGTRPTLRPESSPDPATAAAASTKPAARHA
ncbi:hypothetical protein EYF80_060963 [Liparis tanakae]|uniref:Uncharacterized protein n=1 Tax=Liparis tanakae TaxID=230148 RepID=A0A4Z2EJE0_9TELE|nr:hypothetical protein EYF80_060963 [Liparis tanakae]